MPELGTLIGAGMTRRTFLKLSLGTGVVLAAASAGGLMTTLAACSKTATADVSVTSSSDLGHTHSVTVSGKDIDSPPAQVTYTSSVVNNHSHQITLTKANLDTVKNGQSVSVVSTSTGATPHTHTWDIKKP